MSTTGLAQLSDDLTLLTGLLYSLAILGYAADFAFGKRRAAAAVHPAKEAALVGAGAPVSGSDDPGSADEPAAAAPAEEPGRMSVSMRVALGLTGLGLLVHFFSILTRGLAAQRVPWGNMHEFILAIGFGAVAVFMVVVWRFKAYFAGLFVLIPVVLGIGLASTALYTPVGALMPALKTNYWISIHVTAAVTASGTFIVAGAINVMYLLAARYAKLKADGGEIGFSGIARKMPEASVLDRLSYRIAIFGFPIWTFAIVAGAMWADQAWGRYWGWDPKEVWSFITWVVYAGYLHARSTAGWRGQKAAWIQLLAFGCLMFNLFGVNIWFSGLHSYAGL
ncbi:MAG TPA: c-type cytochrome biogenesis protein CcsB [Streptosporangiaceae bacterium]